MMMVMRLFDMLIMGMRDDNTNVCYSCSYDFYGRNNDEGALPGLFFSFLFLEE